MQRPVTPGNWHHEKLPGLFTEWLRPLCPGWTGSPCRLLQGLCQAGSPSSPTLRGGFVQGTIRHSEETTQLPTSLPENKTVPLCANDLPLCQAPSCHPSPCQGEIERQSGQLCGNPRDGVLMSCPSWRPNTLSLGRCCHPVASLPLGS